MRKFVTLFSTLFFCSTAVFAQGGGVIPVNAVYMITEIKCKSGITHPGFQEQVNGIRFAASLRAIIAARYATVAVVDNQVTVAWRVRGADTKDGIPICNNGGSDTYLTFVYQRNIL